MSPAGDPERVAAADVEVRPWAPDDAEALGRAVQASLEHLRPWLTWADEPMDVEDRRALIERWAAEEAAGGDRYRGIFVAGAVAGGCGLHRRVGPGAWEIGYWVHAGHARRGVATAAVARLVEEAFADPAVTHVEIHHDRANTASGRVAARAGFHHVADGRDAPTAPGDTGIERIWRLARPPA